MPRRDVQVVIFSNCHLFEANGIYNRKREKYMVTREMAANLYSRFHVFRLDDPLVLVGCDFVNIMTMEKLGQKEGLKTCMLTVASLHAVRTSCVKL